MTVLLFTGDSVTDAERRSTPDGLGEGYVHLLAETLPQHRVLNTGISGNRVRDLVERWDDDVLAHDPEVVTVLIGVNDMWRRFDSDDPTTAAEFETGYRDILRRTARSGAALLLMEPFLLPVREEQFAWRDDLDAKIAVVHALAAEFGAGLVPLDAAFGARAEPAVDLASDGVHPTPLGHAVIAERWRATAGF